MEQENLESLNNLIENLKYYNRDISQIPLIMQYNKRDLDNIMSMEELDALLNPRKLASFAASAVTGSGVLQALTACCKQVLNDLKRKSQQTSQAAAAGAQIKTQASVTPNPSQNREQAPPPLNDQPKTTTPVKHFQAQTEPPLTGGANLPDATSNTHFKPEIAQIGKPRLITPQTITLPLRLATEPESGKLLSVDITLTINDFV